MRLFHKQKRKQKKEKLFSFVLWFAFLFFLERSLTSPTPSSAGSAMPPRVHGQGHTARHQAEHGGQRKASGSPRHPSGAP